MPPPRPRSFGNSPGISGGRPSPSTPMSERQQMALLMQMTSASPSCSPDVHQSLNNINQLASRSRDRNERGETSLHVAAIKGDQEGVKKLLESGVNPNVLDFAGWSPLHEACNHGFYNIAFALIKAGANVNAKGLDDDTPLHDAAVIGNMKLVKLLIEKGADLFAKNRKGKTPTDVAASTISTYMCSLRDASHNKSAQTLKKVVLSDLRRSSEGDDGSNVDTGESNEENNVVNLKKNCKDFMNIDDGKNQSRHKVDKLIQKDEFYNEDDTTNSFKLTSFNSNTAIKRSHSDIEMEESLDTDEIKRKKRKDSDNFKETSKPIVNTKIPTRNDKTTKQAVALSKPSSVVLKMSSERKSPCVSPKPTPLKIHDGDLESEDTKVNECISGNGPKVPPLKIVIPQQNCTNDPESGSRNGKVNSVRNQIAHPYVVSSSNSNDSLSAEKETNPSRCNSPTELVQKNNSATINILQEEKNVKLSNEEKGQQRILRSSHRSGGHNIDRSSNNSSPQLQSNSPSPATLNDMSDKNLNLTNNNTLALQVQNQTLETENVIMPNLSNISSPSLKDMQSNSVELHPRKRKIRTKHEESFVKAHSTGVGSEQNNTYDIHPHDHPFTNCYHMYLNIRNQIEKKHRTLFPVQPRPPQGFSEYLLNRRSYLLANTHTPESCHTTPPDLPPQMIDLFNSQEKERQKLKLKHIVEKEKLGLTVEQEILRVHGKAARSLACQSVPFSVCTFLKDEEVYNLITPEQEEKDRNARSRYNGRLFISWLQDVDDKWEKIKEAMVLRHHNEAESLHALQRMGWDEVLKDNDLCDSTSKPYIQEDHVPIVHVSDDFELLPA
ncbi:ankyrin repeat domain-containing protein 12 [Episyrphus balteatus]|uniref:ankyrin repeat domain-containing protein 12 n=1 Tax=Episyrphus balteatus TaxID=286459 RepID=UPI0024860875|nr:ankyrin repeat domain-containing protein 12 [Episyrphus balteatus]XP_055838116.1 ankyrin repeat domain-containing protein 12 [Episyrphus balteatus]XP_055838117.1 ankyrin repeat domain-containing protein 12 [Episyrphus balteatus]XP_055838118.1 ankyrin repeat domain-containing protein 12 [Episyrphus balteatus]